jgi:sterol desaturase/sphingolipid hydroxylase (fatty acid hydroxylase superfamily)
MNVEINWIAVGLATVAAMIVGFVWYHKNVFGTVWMKLAGIEPDQMKKGFAAPMLLALLGSLLTAFILAHMAFIAHAFYKNSFFMDAVTTAFWLWLGLSFTTLIIHNSFERKPAKLTALAVGNRFVTLLVMGMVIGLLKP